MQNSVRSFLAAVAALFILTLMGAPQALAREPTRTIVEFRSQRYAPGTIVIVNTEKKLYYVLGNGKAIRYDVAVGKSRAQWTGVRTVERKMVNPPWTPTPRMRARNPGMRAVAGGSPKNPLGVRAIYIGGMYRIHGTNAPESIGTAASSGCIRMLNADVIDLYKQVAVGTRVIVLNKLPGDVVASN